MVPAEGLLQHVYPVSADCLLADGVGLSRHVGADVLGVGIERKARDVGGVVTAAIAVSVAQVVAEALQRAHPVGGSDRIDGVVVRHLGLHGGLAGAVGGVAGHVLVDVGVDVANTQHEVALARVLDRVAPIGDHGETVDPTCLRCGVGIAQRTPGLDVTKILVVPDDRVVQLADRVVVLVVARKDLAELVQVVHYATVRDGDPRGCG
jgi:hypothetical protein